MKKRLYLLCAIIFICVLSGCVSGNENDPAVNAGNDEIPSDTSQYDENGDSIFDYEYHDDGSWEKFEYDENGNCVKAIHYDTDGSLICWYEHEYDEISYLFL